MSSLELYIEPAAYGLPCLSAESLAALAHLQNVAPSSFLVHYTANAIALVTGKLPTLHDTSSGTWTAGFAAIVTYLAKLGLDTEEQLSTRERAESVALQVLVEQQASALTSKALFGDDDNYAAVRKLLGQVLSVPYNYSIPTQLRKAATDALGEAELDASSSKKKGNVLQATASHSSAFRVEQEAGALYGMIERQLSDKPFLFGKHATACDALVCGHLSLHLFPELPNPVLANLLKDSYPRIRSYLTTFQTGVRPVEEAPGTSLRIGHMVTAFWREVTGARSKPKKAPKQTTEESVQRLRARKEKLMFAAASVLGLVGFILFNGIITFETEEDEEFTDAEALNEEEEDLSDDELE